MKGEFKDYFILIRPVTMIGFIEIRRLLRVERYFVKERKGVEGDVVLSSSLPNVTRCVYLYRKLYFIALYFTFFAHKFDVSNKENS